MESSYKKQVTAANEMVDNYHNPDVRMSKQGKIFAIGTACPSVGQAIMTRMYIGIDPRHSADAFKTLIKEMSKNGSVRDIEIAFNEEDIEAGKITDNMLVIYEPLSRPDVLNKILSAYRTAKAAQPDVFNLTPRQREAVMRSAFRRFKAVVDANLSFVEMDPEEYGRSWDSGELANIREGFGIFDHIKGREIKSDYEWLKIIQDKENAGVILTDTSQKQLKSGSVKTGDQLEYKRKLLAPALVQRGTITVK